MEYIHQATLLAQGILLFALVSLRFTHFALLLLIAAKIQLFVSSPLYQHADNGNMDASEKLYALLVKLNEKVDTQNTILREIRDLLKKQLEKPQKTDNSATITCHELGVPDR